MREMINVPEIFGTDVFNEATMKQRLAPEVYVAWKRCISTGSSLLRAAPWHGKIREKTSRAI